MARTDHHSNGSSDDLPVNRLVHSPGTDEDDAPMVCVETFPSAGALPFVYQAVCSTSPTYQLCVLILTV
jgi:hypothetical protein